MAVVTVLVETDSYFSLFLNLFTYRLLLAVVEILILNLVYLFFIIFYRAFFR